jgi:hypothetical protein
MMFIIEKMRPGHGISFKLDLNGFLAANLAVGLSLLMVVLTSESA